MNFDDGRRRATNGFVREHISRTDSKNRLASCEPTEARPDIDDLIVLMSSRKKIQTNRNNAEKSTGPRSERGKGLARFNAQKHGVFSVRRLIPGEDEKQYKQLSARLVAELAPNCFIEGMLVDQIIADMWRLGRLEQAERTYFSRVQESVYERLVRSLQDSEYALLKQLVRRVHSERSSAVVEPLETKPYTNCSGELGSETADGSDSQFDAAVLCSLEGKLDRAFDLGTSLLEGIVDPNRTFPYSTLDQIRRSLVRDILRKYESLTELQRVGGLVKAQ